MIGRILSNRYKLIAELGSGGMAWVYLAEDLIQGGEVAVKILYPQHSQDTGFLQRFGQEARLSMALSQSEPQAHIVHVLDYGADQDTHYLVMEFVPGQDLGQLLEEGGALPCHRALELARQVALALEHAHRHGVVHRDIKPSNIMVLPDGSARVLDFGIARAQSSPNLTVSGFVGSPNYAAPEQVMGRPVDIRADIYSLGIVLYRMLSGELPFQGDTPWAVVSQHVAATPPSLEQIRPGVPPSVVELVNRAMAKRPEDRFQTPGELVEAIDAIEAPDGQEVCIDLDEVARPGPDLPALYDQAQQAMAAGHWHEAVDLYSHILRSNPAYKDAAEQLGAAGQQIRLGSLYRAASRALESGRWDEAEGQLRQILETDPDYRNASELMAHVRRKSRPRTIAPAQAPESPTLAPRSAGATSSPLVSQERRRHWLLWVGALSLAILLAAGLYSVLAGQAPTPPTATASMQPSQTEATAPAGPSVPAAPVDTSRPTAATSVEGPTVTATQAAPTEKAPRLSATPAPTTWPEPSGQIAFPRFDPARGTYDIYACQVDGGSCRLVVAEASQPDYLPSGHHIVYHSWKPDDKGVFVLFLEDQRLWRITGQIEAARPSVDAQGQSYVFQSRQEADRQPRLYRTYGVEVRPLVRGASAVLGSAPSWTPGGRILYTGCLGNSCGILLMQADGSRPRQIIAGTSETNAEASPGGESLVFMSWDENNWNVYLANLDGSGLRALSLNPANDGLPTWSPPGWNPIAASVSHRRPLGWQGSRGGKPRGPGLGGGADLLGTDAISYHTDSLSSAARSAANGPEESRGRQGRHEYAGRSVIPRERSDANRR
jgi:Tol biopolymer transport system component/predicted Ser/Thr protein kinase